GGGGAGGGGLGARGGAMIGGGGGAGVSKDVPAHVRAGERPTRCIASGWLSGRSPLYCSGLSDRSAASRSSSTAPTRYRSVAQAPRSTSWQRSEQNGRCLLAGTHGTWAPQRGQFT